MFGYIIADISSLSEEEKQIYRSYYCGLCNSLHIRYGNLSRMTLTYDMTFLIILLSSLYSDTSEVKYEKCILHPIHKHPFITNNITDYAADMNIILSYYNLIDNWTDDKDLISLSASSLISKNVKRCEGRYPRQSKKIKECLNRLSEIENLNIPNADLPSACFGELMSEIFCYKNDKYEDDLRQFGFHLGKLIYIMDACIDLKKDLKKMKYNPMSTIVGIDYYDILSSLLHECVESYKKLPIVDNKHIIENILYIGIWTKYNTCFKLQKESGK